MQWVIKTTKLCNLRCKYCYEWEHLSDPTRMSEAVWRRALITIRDYAELTRQRCGHDIPVDIIWHGGEPTLLPRAYFERVFALQREIFPNEWIESRRVRNCLQTNLYSVRDEHLDVFEEYGIELGVSVDFAEGVRLTAGGRATESAVRANIRRLQDRGLPFSIISVLAGHTVSQIEQVFDEITRINKPARLLPLFGGPPTRSMEGVTVGLSDILDAIMVFFDLWFSAGMAPRVDPLDQCMRTVILKRLNVVRPRQNRALLGNDVLVIDRDGTLACDTYREHGNLGNVTETPIEDIVDGLAYRNLIAEETRLKGSVCTECPFLGACDTSPIARHFDSHVLQDCPLDKYLLPRIDAHLENRGFFDDDFNSTAQDVMAAHMAEARGATVSY
ncbi:Anaerobic sulfatase-maturating enzyme [Mycobacterium simulans]|uniref:radical SAM protein n=1 Tax=Mycobacterium simulans TaxID=627089 RepID=UPI00174DA4FF|nr:radical SAM protein [Mycobacterium simulans]SON59732.1 Anaerobic sulfatase-maturating enzyme [Mycobacterium simulans]